MTREDKYRADFEACVEELREPLITVSKISVQPLPLDRYFSRFGKGSKRNR